MRARLAIFGLAALSIGSLLLYFAGVGRFGRTAPALLAVEAIGLTIVAIDARRNGRRDLTALLAAGLWAGCLATIAYDLVRLPLIHLHLPVFNSISYFGMVLLGVERSTPASEAVGWAYHLSNGVSFGLMYAALVPRPRAFSGILWGLLLEGVMLLTPYAEVFGYARDAKLMSITLASHVCYGAVLWLALRSFGTARAVIRAASLSLVPLLLAGIAADFRSLYAGTLPPAPPPYLGSHLYTCWSSPEPDRIAVLWLLQRHVDPAAEFYFIEPFDKIPFGTPLDVPEASIRREGTLSATEILIRRANIALTPPLQLLVRTTHVAEVAPWTMIADSDAGETASALRRMAADACGAKLHASCLPPLFAKLDRRYGAEGR
jgi:hypothetical protein